MIEVVLLIKEVERRNKAVVPDTKFQYYHKNKKQCNLAVNILIFYHPLIVHIFSFRYIYSHPPLPTGNIYTLITCVRLCLVITFFYFFFNLSPKTFILFKFLTIFYLLFYQQLNHILKRKKNLFKFS